jgi:hypothetical protein
MSLPEPKASRFLVRDDGERLGGAPCHLGGASGSIVIGRGKRDGNRVGAVVKLSAENKLLTIRNEPTASRPIARNVSWAS